MKKLILIILLAFVPSTSVFSYKILYAEQFYKLYHRHFYQYPEDYLENIYYLEEALRSDFANPLNALAIIKNKSDWERYRNLFRMHVSLKLTDLYLGLGSKYDKRNRYFFNAPWQRENIKSLEIAKESYEYAKVYWEEALKWNEKIKHSWVCLEEVQNWEDESFRIREKELDYNAIIDRHLTRLDKVLDEFLKMDSSTY
ncbi:MAG: hypothetical protein RBT69_11645 [Spirochaetia bacterium]|jgi:hypothetical protein|nr:hypothetical protein [Spirochaetia bacterium]